MSWLGEERKLCIRWVWAGWGHLPCRVARGSEGGSVGVQLGGVRVGELGGVIGLDVGGTGRRGWRLLRMLPRAAGYGGGAGLGVSRMGRSGGGVGSSVAIAGATSEGAIAGHKRRLQAWQWAKPGNWRCPQSRQATSAQGNRPGLCLQEALARRPNLNPRRRQRGRPSLNRRRL